MLLTESKLTEILTEGLKYHLETKTPLYENIFRPGSEEYFSTIRQARTLMNKGILTELCFEDIELLFETEVGEYGEYNGQNVPLDFPMLEEEVIVTQPQSTQIINAWNTAKQNPDILAIITKEAQTKGQEPYALWIDVAGKAKAQMGVAYTIEASAISQFLTEQEDDTAVSTSVVMPIIVKYKKDGNVIYTLVEGQEAYEQIKDTDAEVWVVDLSELQGEASSMQELTRVIREADMPLEKKAALIKKIIDLAKKQGAHTSMDQLAMLIAKQIEINTTGKLKPGEFRQIKEAKYQGKEVALNKPKRGGPKKFYVYTRNPKTGKIIKVNFGDTTGLSAKINNKEARVAFAKRHKCSTKKDKTKAGYWSCRLPRYASLLGLKSSFGGYW